MNLLSYFDSIMSETYDEESNWILCLKCYKRIPRIRIFDYNENIMISMNCDCSVKTRVMLLDEYLEICKEEKRKNLFTQDNYCIQCEKFYPDEIRRVHDNMIFSVNHIIINREIKIQYRCQSELHKNQKILAKYYSLETYKLFCKGCAESTDINKCRKLADLRSETKEIIDRLGSLNKQTQIIENYQSIVKLIDILKNMFEVITEVNMPDLNLSFSILNIFHYINTKKDFFSFLSNIEFSIILSPDIPIEPLPSSMDEKGVIPYIMPTSSDLALVGFNIAQPQLMKYGETVCNFIHNSLKCPFLHLIRYLSSPNKFLGITKSRTNEFSFSKLQIERINELPLDKQTAFLFEEELTTQKCSIKNEINCICFLSDEMFATAGKSIDIWEIKNEYIYLKASIDNDEAIITNSIIYMNYSSISIQSKNLKRSLSFTIENKLICGNNDGQVQFMELRDNQLVIQKTQPLHSKQITCLKKITNKSFASGGDDCKIAIYFQGNTKDKKILYGHKGPIVNIEVFINTNEIISAGKDKQIIIWDIESRCKLKIFTPKSITEVENMYDLTSFCLFKGENDYYFFISLSLKDEEYEGFQNIIEIWKSKNFDKYFKRNSYWESNLTSTPM